MALTFRDKRLILDECDAVGGWTATDGPTAFTAGPTPIEAGTCLGMQVSNAIEDAYTTITSDDMSNGGSLSVWMQDRAEFESSANVGIGIQVGDGTNRIAYSVGGNDGTAFRHDVGPVKWACFLLDLANKPADFIAIAGSEASLNEAAITQVGVRFETTVKSVGGTDNCFWDIIRWADPGSGIQVYGGTAGTKENFETIASGDRGTANQEAYGITRELATKVYGVQGNINLGDGDGTTATFFEIISETIAWENRGLSTGNYYRFNVSGNSTSATEVYFNASTLTVSEGASASCDFSDINSDVSGTSTVFAGFDQGIHLGGRFNEWTANSFNSCGLVETTGVNLANSSFSQADVVSGEAALFWNTVTDTDPYLDGCSFTKGTGDNAAIKFSSLMTGGAITLNDINFDGYNASNDQPDSALYTLGTTGTLTINLVGCNGSIAYRTEGVDVTLVIDPVTTLITVLDSRDTTPISGARVLVEASNGTGDLPYQDSISISVSSGTATVTHTGHGMSNGDKVLIEGANSQDLNGVKTISGVTANSYTYSTTAGDGVDGGTTISTGVVIDGTTDANGEISDIRTWTLAQPVIGRARKSTSSPYYKTAAIAGTISTTAGLSSTVQLIIDE